MAIRFSGFIQPVKPDTLERTIAESYLNTKSATETMVFLSHKTGDTKAKIEARYIADKHHVRVFMAEWDDRIDEESASLPDYIMSAIRESEGFLLNVIPEIGTSMWIGYEIGGAHAMGKLQAKIMNERVGSLPSVFDALPSLRDRHELDNWVRSIKR